MSNETIFREVDEELRGDRLRAFWRRFGPYIIGAAVAVVLVVALNEGWTWWQNSNASRSSDQFYAALELAEDGDIPGAQAALNDVTAQGTGGYPTLARFRQASLLAREGRTGEAIAAYDALATAETNQRIRELALVLSAFLLVDGGDVGTVAQRVGTLALAESPMRNAAREAIGLTQYKGGELDQAMATFEEILADPLAGAEIRGRVQIYVAQLVSLGAGDEAVAAPVAEAPTTEPEAVVAPEAVVEPSVGEAPAMDVVDPAVDAAVPTPAEPQVQDPAAVEANAAADKGRSDADAAIAAAAMAVTAAAPAAAAPAAEPEPTAEPVSAEDKGRADADAAVAAATASN